MYKIYTKIPCVPSGYIQKLLKIMKLTTVILLVTLLQVSASTMAQKITYSKNGATLSEIFKQINIQTGYNVLYSPDLIDENTRIDVNYKNTELKKVLGQVLDKQTQQYTIDNRNILITKVKEPTFLEKIIAAVTAITVHGKIVDEDGNPLPGTTILVKGTNNATVADNKGEFTLTGVDDKAELIITSIGHKPITLKVAAEMGTIKSVSYTHLRAHETGRNLVCRLLLEKKK